VAIVPTKKCLVLHVEDGETTIQNEKIYLFLSNLATETKCPLHYVVSPWIGSDALVTIMNELKQLAREDQRNTLLISGHYLEDQVTICSLEALMEGFDVHLLFDFISARSLLLAPILQQRLFQAGAVPSSLRQFLYMWLAAETEPNMSQHLRQLLKDYDATFIERPRSCGRAVVTRAHYSLL
jgi:hypothetical protein